MNARAESPFDACLKEALALSAEWVPRWLGQLHDTLQQREAAAANLNEKQTFGQARISARSVFPTSTTSNPRGRRWRAAERRMTATESRPSRPDASA